jgi:TusA-related sulfurtransferase
VEKKTKVDRIIDVTGLLCPGPDLITRKTLAELEKGKILEVVSNDKTTKNSIPAMCRKMKYRLVELTEEDGLLHFVIEK